MITLQNVRKALNDVGVYAADNLSDQQLKQAVFMHELAMDSLDFEDLKSEISCQFAVCVPDSVSVTDTVGTFINEVNLLD